MHRETISIKSVFWTVPVTMVAAPAANILIFFAAKFIFGVTPVIPCPGPELGVVPLTAMHVLWVSVVPVLLGAVLFVLLGIFFPWRPVTVFRIVAVIAFVLSLNFPFVIHIAVGTKSILALMHLVAFGITAVVLTGPWGMWKPPPVEKFRPKF